MSKRAPWHAEDSDVYHNNDQCTEGNNIEEENRRNGKGKRDLCKHCKRFNKLDKKRDSRVKPLGPFSQIRID